MTAEIAEMAELMRADLDSRRLLVSLAFPNDPVWVLEGNRAIRIVDDHNPAWYQEFCGHYSPSRRSKPRNRKKPDTYIKRASTLRALAEIAAGQAKTVYADRLLPYIEEEIARLPKNGWMIE